VSGGTEKEILEVIAAQELFIYKIRYIRKPKPIVLYNSPGLTINDLYDTPTDSELPESLHRVILEMAVKNAATIYKQ
jgi:hypothetical protein